MTPTEIWDHMTRLRAQMKRDRNTRRHYWVERKLMDMSSRWRRLSAAEREMAKAVPA